MDEIDIFISPGAIRGYHIYFTIWEAESGEILTTIQERGNVHDRFAVTVKKLQSDTYRWRCQSSVGFLFEEEAV